jgi:hypothetical protein
MADVKPGDRVLYVPDLCHWHNTDRHGELVFQFCHEKGSRGGKPGQPIAPQDVKKLGRVESRNEAGHLVTSAGHVVRPDKPLFYWEARVERVHADGSADLTVFHPNGAVTYAYPDRQAHPQAPGVRRDPAKALHTFHVEGE